MKKLWLLTFFIFSSLCMEVQSQSPEETEVWSPEPSQVKFSNVGIPSDAILLFKGEDLNQWQHEDGRDVEWNIQEASFTVKPGSGDIITKEKYGSCQLHIEWKSPSEIIGSGQGRGNSGLFFQNRYEVQILDSYQNRTYSNGQAGSVYKQHIPLVNASREPGLWQSYDIIFTAPEFNQAGEKIRPAYLTIFHNNVLIQNHVRVMGSTEYIGEPKNEAHEEAPLKLQDHGNPVSFRNIWIRKL